MFLSFKHNVFLWNPFVHHSGAHQSDTEQILKKLEGIHNVVLLSDGTDFLRLLKELSNQEYHNFLVIDIPQVQGIRLKRILARTPRETYYKLQEIISAIGNAESKKLQEELISEVQVLEEVLAWAEIVHRLGWQVLIVIAEDSVSEPSKEEDNLSLMTKDSDLATDSRLLSLAQIRYAKDVNSDKENEQQPIFGFGVISSNRRRKQGLPEVIANISCTLRLGLENRDLTGGILSPPHDADWGVYEPPEPSNTFRYCLSNELGNDPAIIKDFHEVVGGLSLYYRLEDLNKNKVGRILLGILKTARVLAKRSFEGRDCRTNLIVIPDSEKELLSPNESSFPARESFFDYNADDENEKTFFHLADGNLREADIELAQSDDLCFIVSLDDSRLRSICTIDYDESGSRFPKITNTGLKNHLFISLRPLGYVEVFYKKNLVFWYDRTQWRLNPYKRLNELLEIFYNAVSSEGNEAEPESFHKTIRMIIGTVERMMDNQESSIIVFMNSDDRGNLSNNVLKPLREQQNGSDNPRFKINNIKIDGESISSLSAIFRLDGAHVVCGKEVVMICQDIDVSFDTSGAETVRSRAPGAGRRRAGELSKKIQKPGFVLKVSSSGSLHLFEGNLKKKV